MQRKANETRTRLLEMAYDLAEAIARGREEVKDFSFYLKRDGGLLLGGNTLKIWYHPDGPKSEGRSLVLDMWWQNFDSPHYTKFDDDKEWQKRLRAIVAFKNKTAANAIEAHIVSELRKKKRDERIKELWNALEENPP